MFFHIIWRLQKSNMISFWSMQEKLNFGLSKIIAKLLKIA